MKAIDLFCGCGGLSAGLRDAGFKILAGIDIEKDYIKTFTKNFPNSESICSDLSKIDSYELMNRFNLKRGELDLLAGGPPCQGFSKNVPRSQRLVDSDNNKLVDVFLSHCERILPKFILMENVAEMRNGFDQYYTDQIVSRLSNVGYDVIHGVHNSADYGVPQRRKRAFFIARRDGIKPIYPKETHSSINEKDGMKKYISVWDAISDLRPLNSGEGVEPDSYVSKPLNEYQQYIRNGNKVVFNHIAKKLSKIQQERMSSLKAGEGIKDLPDHLRPKSGYSGAYGRLTKEMIMPTITRWVFHPGSGRFGHPVDDRVITIREAARLHSFKDDFIFIGTYTQQAGQLGNSVPPLLAKIMGESFLS
ncbi:DNA cytosine methyltransferase [Providencia sp. PROV141]|uniref:DNA cytosine methyltransferase n=1 Tax=Providencia sp. PROV141 TaxID=2949851 RepID=UPI00234BE2C8|nr:DNA cytosine methyltransferase [Providencia sp. PROV141]